MTTTYQDVQEAGSARFMSGSSSHMDQMPKPRRQQDDDWRRLMELQNDESYQEQPPYKNRGMNDDDLRKRRRDMLTNGGFVMQQQSDERDRTENRGWHDRQQGYPDREYGQRSTDANNNNMALGEDGGTYPLSQLRWNESRTTVMTDSTTMNSSSHHQRMMMESNKSLRVRELNESTVGGSYRRSEPLPRFDEDEAHFDYSHRQDQDLQSHRDQELLRHHHRQSSSSRFDYGYGDDRRRRHDDYFADDRSCCTTRTGYDDHPRGRRYYRDYYHDEEEDCRSYQGGYRPREDFQDDRSYASERYHNRVPRHIEGLREWQNDPYYYDRPSSRSYAMRSDYYEEHRRYHSRCHDDGPPRHYDYDRHHPYNHERSYVSRRGGPPPPPLDDMPPPSASIMGTSSHHSSSTRGRSHRHPEDMPLVVSSNHSASTRRSHDPTVDTRRSAAAAEEDQILPRPGAYPVSSPVIDPRRLDAKVRTFAAQVQPDLQQEDPYWIKQQHFGNNNEQQQQLAPVPQPIPEPPPLVLPTIPPANTNSTSDSTDEPQPVGPDDDIFIEIGAGIRARLRRTGETMDAIANDFYAPAVCYGCSSDLFCIADVRYIICPTCQSISPVEDHKHKQEKDFIRRRGVGLGFTYDTLFQMQAELVSNHNGTSRTTKGESSDKQREDR